MTKHAWMLTLNGVQWDLLNPDASKIYLEDIVVPMAGIYRYGNHARTKVDVLWHSLLVHHRAKGAAKPYALIHDMHEAFLQDTTKPNENALEATCPGAKAAIKLLKTRHDFAIWSAFGLSVPSPEIVKEVHRADLQALSDERSEFRARSDERGWPDNLPLPLEIPVSVGVPGRTGRNTTQFRVLLEEYCPKIPPFKPGVAA